MEKTGECQPWFLPYISSDNVYFLLICIKITHSKVKKTCRDCKENLYAYIMMQFFYLISNKKSLWSSQRLEYDFLHVCWQNPNRFPLLKLRGKQNDLWLQWLSRIFKYFCRHEI
ncbi:unnamed protein product [Meganyctiphanes norvegica]|uniref:Uncharacterized protein n=1 Tax=Meganyctiphanes norvegica TaxID=48144 RepID=A0AAV2Q4D5_MEGNR